MIHKSLSVVSLILFTLILSACQSTLNKDIEEYESSMQEIYDLDQSFKNHLKDIDFEQVESLYIGSETELSREDIEEITDIVNEQLIPISEDMNKKINAVDVSNTDIEDAHEDYEESLELKEEFSKELKESIELYLEYIDSRDQLVEDGEAVVSSKEERDNLIQSDHSKKEEKEITEIIDVINEKSEELEKEADVLQEDTSAEDKQKQIEETLLPLLDNQIESVNQLSLNTEKGKEVRAISLEMFYTFKSYYQKRVNLMQIYEEEQNVQLQNIIPLIDTFDKTDKNYHSDLDKLKTRES